MVYCRQGSALPNTQPSRAIHRRVPRHSSRSFPFRSLDHSGSWKGEIVKRHSGIIDKKLFRRRDCMTADTASMITRTVAGYINSTSGCVYVDGSPAKMRVYFN
ncbi:hypothetical protein BaRGS_00018925 [Batillaria attramentaria]|uniref:Uncharacterized protein n=1 Tax=Batillaria attramentaria TaxID=370345 RepID=A0ABD0KSP6_9CAEN